jgi:hypothetical protein
VTGTTPETVLPGAGAEIETDGGVVSHAAVVTFTVDLVERFMLVSSASTPTGIVEPHGRPVTFQEVAVVVPSDVVERKTS